MKDKITTVAAWVAVGLSVAAAVAIVGAAGGCTTFEKRANGTYRYSNGIFDKKIGKLTFETTADGTTKATLEGVQSGLNADALKAIAEGATSGAVRAVK